MNEQQRAVTVINTVMNWDQDQNEVIMNTLAPGISSGELKLFAMVCKETGLDPFSRQIYAVMRYDAESGRKKMTIQVGIDGYRSMADDTGEYDATTAPQWCGTDGVWRDIWLEKTNPAAARIGVRRKGFSDIVWAIARWDAYVQLAKGNVPNRMWAQRGPEQLAKCAESLALRMAFPKKLGGLYTEDEMAQADNEPRTPVVASVARKEAPPVSITEESAPAAINLGTVRTALKDAGYLTGKTQDMWLAERTGHGTPYTPEECATLYHRIKTGEVLDTEPMDGDLIDEVEEVMA